MVDLGFEHENRDSDLVAIILTPLLALIFLVPVAIWAFDRLF
jgi:hypothetical protein